MNHAVHTVHAVCPILFPTTNRAAGSAPHGRCGGGAERRTSKAEPRELREPREPAPAASGPSWRSGRRVKRLHAAASESAEKRLIG